MTSDNISRKEAVRRLQLLAAKRKGSFSGDAFAFAAKVIMGIPAARAPYEWNRIDYAERLAVYNKAINQNGVQLQCVVAVEELSEAAKEICKFLRNMGSTDHLAEEIADATIMLEQMRFAFGVNEKVCRYMDAKVKRLAEKLEDGNG